MVYIERVLSSTVENVLLLPCSWRPIVLGALMLAAKVWDDSAVWNVDFQHIPGMIDLSPADLNELERTMLYIMDFNVNVKSAAFTKCYFNMREHAISHNLAFHCPDLDQAHRQVEILSRRSARAVRRAYAGRSTARVGLNKMRKTMSDTIYSEAVLSYSAAAEFDAIAEE